MFIHRPPVSRLKDRVREGIHTLFDSSLSCCTHAQLGACCYYVDELAEDSFFFEQNQRQRRTVSPARSKLVSELGRYATCHLSRFAAILRCDFAGKPSIMSLKEDNLALPKEMDGVAREDSASKAAGHLHSRDLVDDKIGKHHGPTLLVTPFPICQLATTKKLMGCRRCMGLLTAMQAGHCSFWMQAQAKKVSRRAGMVAQAAGLMRGLHQQQHRCNVLHYQKVLRPDT